MVERAPHHERLVAANTERLFLLLLRLQPVDLICDVGSFDAAQARAFRRARPGARIIAFEANPALFATIANDPAVISAGIEPHHAAVCDHDGSVTFFLEHGGGGKPYHWLQTISSLRRRVPSSATVWSGVPESQGTTATAVPAARLDTVVEQLSPPPRSIALWIDVEGSAFEALKGAAGISDRVTCIHVEIESTALWQGQRLGPDVMALLARRGFRPVATTGGRVQCDVLFVRMGWRSLPMTVIAVLATRVFQLARVCRLVGGRLLRSGSPG